MAPPTDEPGTGNIPWPSQVNQRLNKLEERLLRTENQVMTLAKALRNLGQQFDNYAARLEQLENDLNTLVEGLEEMAETIDAEDEEDGDEDGNTDEDPEETMRLATTAPTPTVPGFEERANGDLAIDETKILDWTEEQMQYIASRLPTPVPLEDYVGKPREMRFHFLEELAKYDIRPLDVAQRPILPPVFTSPVHPERSPVRATASARPTVPMSMVMPEAPLPKGEDGLPTSSPIIGKAIPWHVPREYWRVEGKYHAMHMRAENLREQLIINKVWTCKGFNCHDCVERDQSIDKVVSCAIGENARARSSFHFEFQESDVELVKREQIPGVHHG